MRRRQPDPQPLREILPGVMRSIRGSGRGRLERIQRAWSAAAGPGVASRTRVSGYLDGCIHVEVASAALKHDLATFRVADLLREMRRSLPDLRIREIRFRASPQRRR